MASFYSSSDELEMNEGKFLFVEMASDEIRVFGADTPAELHDFTNAGVYRVLDRQSLPPRTRKKIEELAQNGRKEVGS